MRKKVSIFINSLAAGGAERVVSVLLHELQQEFDIHLVLLSNKIEYDIPANQKIIFLNQDHDGSSIINIIKLPLLALKYKKICSSNKIETSLSFLKRANYINCLSKLLGSASYTIISERTYLSNYLKSTKAAAKLSGTFLTKKLYPSADLIVPNAQLIKTDLEKNFNTRTKFRVINNPINIKLIQQLGLEKTNISFEKFTFISVGGFRSEKNFEVLINAFDKIKDIDCRLLLIGKGYEEKKLKGMVKNLQLEAKIIFPGFDKNPYKYLTKSHCFILSSNFEGFPNTLQEALACGLPVISTDCQSGPREILAPSSDINKMVKDDIEIAEYGILTPVRNVNLMAKALRLMYTDQDLQNSFTSKAVSRAKDFDTIKIIDQFKEILSFTK